MLPACVLLLLAVIATPASSDLVVPNFPDLMVKTRTATADHHTLVTTWLFKGPRQRTEIQDPASSNRIGHPSIYQCDQGLRYLLNESSKTYNTMPIDPAEIRKTAHPMPQLEMSGGEVIVTIDSVDTGERRKIGSYEARHVRSTTTVEPGPGAVTRPSKTETDGWYIDVPGRNCQDSSAPQMGWLTAWSGRRDRVVFKTLGAAPHGLAIEETSTKSEAGMSLVSKTELVEISEQRLDQALFEPPPDYTPAPIAHK
ncbi:MAG TPA: hypothetical protein VK812_16095 [Candidatus Binatus sp.]|jgi:hypothetical protein|nr:hypothetical protein [Candidatus Binatus sp.]